MVETIKLGGKTRKIIFGNYVFKKLKEEHGILLADIAGFFSAAIEASKMASAGTAEDNLKLSASLDFTILYPMVYHALRAGEIYSGAALEEYNLDTVCVWMDLEEGSLMQVIPMISNSLTSLSAQRSEDDGKKKIAKLKS